MDTIRDLIARIEANGHAVTTSGPVSERAVANVEEELGVRLPPSYRAFLKEYGSMAICDTAVSGVLGEEIDGGGGTLCGDTRRFRDDWDLPQYLLVIQADEDAPYCLDTRRASAEGEFPVVCFELGSRHEGKIANDFEEWLRRFVLDRWATEKA